MDFEQALAFILSVEGGYSDEDDDPETMYGITRQVALHYGYRGSMRLIPMALVRKIYRQGYWDRCRCDDLPFHPLRLVVMDAAVNSGPGQSIKWLQGSLGVTVDGLIGPQTLGVLNGMTPTALTDLAERLIETRLAFLQSLKKWRKYGRGWTHRLNRLREVLA